MKKFALVFVAVSCVVAPLILAAPDGIGHRSASGWFDFEDCTFCRTLSKDPALLAHTTWENHPIRNGIMNIMTVDPAYAPAMAAAKLQRQELSQQVQSGDLVGLSLNLCGHCQNFSELVKNGVEIQEVQGIAAVVSLYTSADPALVKRLQAQAARDAEEMDLLRRSVHNQP